MTPEHRRERDDRVNDAAATKDVWYVLARARIEEAPRTLAAAQDAVFRRYLPMARTLANSLCWGNRAEDPVEAEQAAELGLAQAVLGWRRPDSGGFEVFARASITSQLRRLPAASVADAAGHPRPDRQLVAGGEPSRGQS